MKSVPTPLSNLLKPAETSVLSGVVGSTAYGLAGEHSDIDRLGVHIADTAEVLGLDGDSVVKSTQVSTDPDGTSHEIGKFCRLALGGNPTVLELLWLSDHDKGIPVIADSLLENRQAFLSAPKIRSAFGGYATQQAERLQRRATEGRSGFASDLAKRTSKHGRHCARLCLSGIHALETGDLLVDVSDQRDWLFEIGELAVSDIDQFVAEFKRLQTRLDEVDSVLPDEPNTRVVNELLIEARMLMLG